MFASLPVSTRRGPTRQAAQRLLAVNPNVPVESLALDVLDFTSFRSSRPLILALVSCSMSLVSAITDRALPVRVSCRARTQHVTARTQLEHGRLSASVTARSKLLGQSCLRALDVFARSGP